MVEVLQDPTYAPSQTEAAVTSPAVTRWLAVGRGDAACPRHSPGGVALDTVGMSDV